jgi:integrase
MTDMRVDLPGLVVEAHRNGAPRIRVRVKGDKARRITIPVGQDHPDFLQHYHAARDGREWVPGRRRVVERSLDWLCGLYLDYLKKMVEAGQASDATLKQRRSVLTRFCDHLDDDGDRYGGADMDMPPFAIVAIRDAWAATPGAADNLIKTIRAVYRFAKARDMVASNPAAGIEAINITKGGAKPWTLADLKQFRDRHAKGSTARLWLTLTAFTACRIGDARILGRGHEVQRGGITHLEWQPGKKGSAPVSIPMLPALHEATRAVTVIGPAYLLNERGRPFASTEALRVRVQRWIAEAGLTGLSSHGVRKAVGDFLAENGATQHQIMAVMAHTQAKTSEIYTRGVDRRNLASSAMQAMKHLDW